MKPELSRERRGTFLSGLIFFSIGLGALLSPGLVYTLILDIAFIGIIVNGLFFLIRCWRDFSGAELVFSLLAFAFAGILFFNRQLPEWIIRMSFACYCLLVAAVLALQQIINLLNFYQVIWQYVALMIGYLGLGMSLLLIEQISSDLLMRFFGLYFMLLGVRYLFDAYTMVRKDYYWKRTFHLSLPVFVSAILPEWTLKNFNRIMTKIQKRREVNATRPDLLQVMVHVGRHGIQKVGHFTFCYKGIVYSYGNYDHSTERLFGLVGDGVFFCVPKDRYLQNIRRYEENTIFEYGIALSREQERHIDQLLVQLRDNAYRWYTPIERQLDRSQWPSLEKDYPSRLHLRTGAKFYKIKRGQFKTYYVFGDNCVLFADRILGVIGADVLSIRGIISPGTYFQYLQEEVLKENSPVSELVVHHALVS